MTVTTRPELQNANTPCFRGGYRLYTVEHLPFENLPQYADGGPAMVVLEGWGISYTVGHGVQTELHAYKVPYTGEKHELDGSTYPTCKEARRAAYEAGLTAFMVYEDEADRHGLRSA